MTTNELMSELHKLSRTEKLRVVQMLVNELAEEAALLLEKGVDQPIYTPYGNEEAAAVLQKMLNDKKAELD